MLSINWIYANQADFIWLDLIKFNILHYTPSSLCNQITLEEIHVIKLLKVGVLGINGMCVFVFIGYMQIRSILLHLTGDCNALEAA